MARKKEFYGEAYLDDVPAKTLTPRLEHLKEIHQLRNIEILIDEYDDVTEGKVRFYYYSKKAIEDLRRMYQHCPKFQELLTEIVLEE